MVIDQKHSSDVSNEQEVIRYTEKIAKLLRLNEQNARVYKALSRQIQELEKKLDDYHSEYNSLKKTIKRLKRDIRFLKIELEDLDECVNRKTMVNLIHKIVPSLISKKGKILCYFFYSSESFKNSDSNEIIKGSHRYQVREKKDVPHKQRRKARLRKVKQVVV